VNAAELTGQSRGHIVDLADPQCALHMYAAQPFLKMRAAAEAAGFDLAPVSSFRDFSRQLTIWNDKFNGARPLVDAAGRPLDTSELSPQTRIDSILLWSALPGASRHHWGTDVDLIDRQAIPAGFRVRLLPEEFSTPGPFAAVAEWLESNAARFGFFRPFRGVNSGVQAEPWHFSFAPVAEDARRHLTPAVLREAIDAAPLLGKEYVLPRLDELHARFVAAIDLP
jgi:LAS superfamily LD-carboxypeptidase LdcB